MLKKVLLFIKEKGIFSDKGISEGLNLSVDLVKELKEQLIRMGYLEKDIEEKCECSCAGCSKGCSSSLKNFNTWKITDKGLLLLK
ncbi:MAG: FeoC-like transcriptional regulator [Clostridium chrysemydis]|uniref:FeoC-like transcriptional regulator n=1 Tax=Clostridium TaxID=1485 RepID=UPI002153369F|nr:FeoC-like transcriptional regulator [Clostridium sp. LY3-2]MCR6515170.1 FeoC-like transcriptional regulator [Clostridium sp. LY3-2]